MSDPRAATQDEKDLYALYQAKCKAQRDFIAKAVSMALPGEHLLLAKLIKSELAGDSVAVHAVLRSALTSRNIATDPPGDGDDDFGPIDTEELPA